MVRPLNDYITEVTANLDNLVRHQTETKIDMLKANCNHNDEFK